MSPPTRDWGQLFGDGVQCCAAPIADAQGTLYEEEKALVARAVPGRLAEFRAGRTLARRALAELGFSPCPVLRAGRAAPCWPNGVVGALTHTQGDKGGWCGAVVARAERFAGVGLDAERRERLGPELWPKVFAHAEQAYLGQLGERAAAIATMMFSAKEAFYKLQFALTGRYLGFLAVTVEPAAEGTFDVILQEKVHERLPRGGRLPGRYLQTEDLVVTGMQLER